MHAQNRISQDAGQPGAAKRWPQRAENQFLGVGPSDDKATNQNIVTARDGPARRKIERFWSHSRKLCTLQMQRNGIIELVTEVSRILVVENLLAGRIQTE